MVKVECVLSSHIICKQRNAHFLAFSFFCLVPKTWPTPLFLWISGGVGEEDDSGYYGRSSCHSLPLNYSCLTHMEHLFSGNSTNCFNIFFFTWLTCFFKPTTWCHFPNTGERQTCSFCGHYSLSHPTSVLPFLTCHLVSERHAHAQKIHEVMCRTNEFMCCSFPAPLPHETNYHKTWTTVRSTTPGYAVANIKVQSLLLHIL